jgi:hypothetical protein
MHPAHSKLVTRTDGLLLVLVVWALLWSVGAGQSLSGADGASGTEVNRALSDQIRADDGGVVWAESYSRQFPGCVALALWPPDEKPVAVVTRASDGEVTRLEPHAPAHTWGHVIGACR